MIEAKIDSAEIEKLREFFQSTDVELNRASNRAIKKTINWVKNQSIKEVSAQSGIQQKILKGRAQTSFNYTSKVGKFWFGIYRVSLIRLNPKQNKSGVKAGSRGSIYRENAFIAPIANGKNFTHQVFKRNGSWCIPSKGTYIGRITKRAGSRSGPKGSKLKREELYKQVFDLNLASDVIEKKIIPEVSNEMIKRLRQELKWEATKR